MFKLQIPNVQFGFNHPGTRAAVVNFLREAADAFEKGTVQANVSGSLEFEARSEKEFVFKCDLVAVES